MSIDLFNKSYYRKIAFKVLVNECADKHLVHQMGVVFITCGYCCHLVVICGATSTGTSAFPLALHHPSMPRLAMSTIPSPCRWDTAWWNGERPFAWAWSMRKKARDTRVLGSTRLIRHSPFDTLKPQQNGRHFAYDISNELLHFD